MYGNYTPIATKKTKDFKRLPIGCNKMKSSVPFLIFLITRNYLERADQVIKTTNKFLKLSVKVYIVLFDTSTQ